MADIEEVEFMMVMNRLTDGTVQTIVTLPGKKPVELPPNPMMDMLRNQLRTFAQMMGDDLR